MNAEGVGAAISAEFLQATATGLPMLVAALWLVLGLGSLWRGWIWRRAGSSVMATAAGLGGRVEATWAGWRVVAGPVEVEYVGGVRGPRTDVIFRRPGLRGRLWPPQTSRPGLIGPEETMTLIAELESLP